MPRELIKTIVGYAVLHTTRFGGGDLAIDAGSTKHVHKEMVSLEHRLREPSSPLC